MDEARKKLTRSQNDKMIAGVCGGFAEYYNVNVTVFRALFILATFAGGTAILFYGLLWVTLPAE